jgi:hypothetical protein
MILWNNIDRATKLCVFKVQSVLRFFTVHLLEQDMLLVKKGLYGLKYALYDSFIVGDFFLLPQLSQYKIYLPKIYK